MQNKQVTNNEIISRINETDTNLRNSIIKTNNSLNDLIDFLKEHMATKEDLKNYATKEDLLSFKSEIIQHIDGFAVKLNKYDAEISANRLSIDRLDTRMTKIETK